MSTVLLVVHLMIAAALVGIVLVQKSEGGALGIGGGGGGMFAGRGKANLMTRATAALGAAFFATSLSLTVLSQRSSTPASVLDQPAATAPAVPAAPGDAPAAPAVPAGDAPRGGILDKLR